MNKNEGVTVNRKYKDRLFVWLFGREERRANVLELYNALHGTDYKDPNMVEINTIENAVYITMHNDVSFLLSGNMLNLYEEQSTFNPNMPIRGLMYIAQLYSGYIRKNRLNPFGETKFEIPAPQYIVFYLGKKDEPDRMELKLSDSFPKKDMIDFEPCIEMTAVMLNVNAGHNRKILEACRALREYSQMIQTVREYTKKGMTPEKAIRDAVEYCINNNILADELRENKAEVIGMLLSEYDEKTIRELFMAEGEAKGRAEGEAKGKAEGKVIELVNLTRDGMLHEDAAADRAEKKYGIKKEDFRKMLENYKDD